MRSFLRCLPLGLLLITLTACQSPTDPSSAVSYDDAIDAVVTPDPISAEASTSNRTYRIVRGNNQPDEIATYDWHTVFTTTVSFNATSTDKDVDIQFPVRLTSTSLVVKQATGGIITAPTGSEKEYFEFVTLSASSNTFAVVGSGATLMFEAWYDLPSLRKEAVITVTYSFTDDDGTAFQKSEEFRVAP